MTLRDCCLHLEGLVGRSHVPTFTVVSPSPEMKALADLIPLARRILDEKPWGHLQRGFHVGN